MPIYTHNCLRSIPSCIPSCYFITALLIVVFCYLQIADSASPCQQAGLYSSSEKTNFSFCCCRTLLMRTVDVNVTTNTTANLTYVLVNTVLNWYKEITDVNETLYDSSTLTCFSNNVTILNDTSRQLEECHCSNVYANLHQHRQTAAQTEGFTCPKAKIFIGGFFDLHSAVGLRTLPAAQIALQEINADNSYLPEYELVLENDNSTNKGLHNYGSHILLNHLLEQPWKVFLLGPNHNLLAKTVAATASLDQFNVIQISSKTDDLDLTYDRVAYKNFFRTNPTVQEINDARIKVVLYYQWKNVGLLYSSQPFYQRLNAILKEKLRANGINVVFEASFHSNPAGALQDIKNHGVRVVLGSYSDIFSSQVFCQVYCLKMFSPLYVFLMMGQFIPTSTSICSATKVGCAARHQFFFNLVPAYLENNTQIIQNRNVFLGKYRGLVTPSYLNDLNDAYYMYDTVWTMANVLQRAKSTLQSLNINLDQLQYGQTTARATIRNFVLSTDWIGLTGRIRFHTNGDRYTDVSITQNLGGVAFTNIGEYETKFSVLRLRSVNWLGWKPHQDITIENVYRYVNYSLHLCLFVLALIGVFFAAIIFVYILVRRKTFFVRNTFWQVNLFVVIGAGLTYFSIISFVSDSSSNILGLTGYEICLLRKILFCLGATFIVGALFVKLHAAFTISTRNLCFLQRGVTKRMFIYFCLVVLFTVIILVIWCLFTPFEMILKKIEEKKEILCTTYEIDFDPFLKKIIYVNACSDFSYPFAVMVVWLIGLTLVSLYLAVKTRHMFITSMIDTWQCGLCVYVITFGVVVGVICGFLTATVPSVFAGIVGLTIWLCVTAVLLILFLYLLLNDPSNCCFKLSSCLCCAAICGCCCDCCCGGRCVRQSHNKDNSTLSKQEDIVMFQRYHNRLPPSSPNESLSSKRSGSASLNDVNLQGSCNSLIKGKKKRKTCCCSNSLSWLMYGVPDAKESGDNNYDDYYKTGKSRSGRVIYRRGRRKRRHVATQTQRRYNNNMKRIGNGSNDLQLTDVDSDAGDGLKNVYTNQDHSPLKIYDKKLDWSHVKSHLMVNGIINKWKIREFSSTGDIPSTSNIEDNKSSSSAIVLSNPNSNDNTSIKSQSEQSGDTLDSGSGSRKTLKTDNRRNTVVIPKYKHDYSHIKSSVNSGLSPGQARRASSKVGLGKVSPNTHRASLMVRSTQDDNNIKTIVTSQKDNNNPVIKISDSSLESKPVSTPPVRIVNGPGSKPTPEQPGNQFLQKNSSSVKVTTLANTSSGL